MAISIVVCLLLILSTISSSLGREAGDTHIVYLGNVDKSLHPDAVTESHHALLQGVLGSMEAARESMGFSYRHGFSGFSARLTEEQAARISALPSVLSVFPNKIHTVHTTNSWEFLGLYGRRKNSLYGASQDTESSWLWKEANYGEDIIIGVLDTGVWPESESFSDHGMGPIPKRWKGTCQTGEQFDASHCNKKLIGARFFDYALKGGPEAYAKENRELLSPRDVHGHGTHTASTAGGRFVENASFFGYANGTANGGAPDSRLAIYKICWRNITDITVRCPASHILSAFDMGIHDGVDIFSLSLGGPVSDYFREPISIGGFHAMQKGIVVVASAGNEQQTEGPGSVKNVAPWIITVGASSLDRAFFADVFLGNNESFRGLGFTRQTLTQMWYPLVLSSDVSLPRSNFSASQICFGGSLDPEKVQGKIVACLGGEIEPSYQTDEVRRAGGVGVIIYNSPFYFDQNFEALPSVRLVNPKAGHAISSYINSTSSPVANIQHHITLRNVKPAPIMASFSSSGPSPVDLNILKPDITAPGVNILAAFTQYNNTGSKFVTLSGTSMSCPHVTGIVALLRKYRPSWSPAAIKSAIVTTGYAFDNLGETIKESPYLAPATPFDFGGGHVNPNAAAHPGLVYDANEQDYIGYLCGLGYNETELMILTGTFAKCPENPKALNYPSIVISDLQRRSVVHRRVTNVDDHATNYTASIEAPESVSVSVHPSVLQFKYMGETKAFQVIFRVMDGSNIGEVLYGKLIWSNGKYTVTSPIVVHPTDFS